MLVPLLCCRYHSIDEYALIDLPAQVNTALKVAGAKKLAIVGHSQVRADMEHSLNFDACLGSRLDK
jgi:hypothetical protein